MLLTGKCYFRKTGENPPYFNGEMIAWFRCETLQFMQLIVAFERVFWYNKPMVQHRTLIIEYMGL